MNGVVSIKKLDRVVIGVVCVLFGDDAYLASAFVLHKVSDFDHICSITYLRMCSSEWTLWLLRSTSKKQQHNDLSLQDIFENFSRSHHNLNVEIVNGSPTTLVLSFFKIQVSY